MRQLPQKVPPIFYMYVLVVLAMTAFAISRVGYI